MRFSRGRPTTQTQDMRIDHDALPTDITPLNEMIGALMAKRNNERAEAEAEINGLCNLNKGPAAQPIRTSFRAPLIVTAS